MIVLKYSALNGIYSQCPYIRGVSGCGTTPMPGSERSAFTRRGLQRYHVCDQTCSLPPSSKRRFHGLMASTSTGRYSDTKHSHSAVRTKFY